MTATKKNPLLKFLMPCLAVLAIIAVVIASKAAVPDNNSDSPDPDNVISAENPDGSLTLPPPAMRYIEEIDVHARVEGFQASICKMCHSTQYDDWLGSTHSMAVTKAGFSTALEHTTLEFGHEKAAECFACHAPYDPTAEGLSADGRVLPDAVAMDGVNCRTCHSREIRAGHYILEPERTKEYVDPTQPQWCASCHDQTEPLMAIVSPEFAQAHGVSDPGGNPYAEWLAGAYSQPGDNYKTCLDCHGQKGTGTQHTWPKDKVELVRSAFTVETEKTENENGFVASVKISNTGCGHMLPSGDPGRALYVGVWMVTTSGEIIATADHTVARYQSLNYCAGDSRIPPGGSSSFEVVYDGDEIKSTDDYFVKYWIHYGYNPVDEAFLSEIGVETERVLIDEN